MYSHPSGDTYKGEWKDGKPHGKGELTSLITFYMPFWDKEGIKDDEEMFGSKSKYIGNFLNGEKHGKGKLIWLDMSAYEGDWEFGKMTG